MPLSSQDKLALALTSAGSMRNLAKLVGVTHQKIGRWLREGQPDGAKKIPDEATAAINVAFAFHKDITRQQSKIDRFPYDPTAPVFVERPTLRNGSPSDRVLVDNTQYIKPELRDQILENLKDTGQIIGVSVRSQINLRSYLKLAPDADMEAVLKKIKRPNLEATFKYREENKSGSGYVAPIYTRTADFSPKAKTNKSLSDLNDRLQEKHSAHATVFADQFLIQTYPGQYANQKPKRETAAQKRAKLIRR